MNNGKIVASYLVKLHLHAPIGDDAAPPITDDEGLTNDRVAGAIIAGVSKEISVASVTVSLIERTDD